MLLGLLPKDELDLIQPHMSQIDFGLRDYMYRDGEAGEFAFFPHAGVFSMVSRPDQEKGLLVEIATSVTVAASMLQKAGLIPYSRGPIVIADRKGLEAASCDCHRMIRDEFERLIR